MNNPRAFIENEMTMKRIPRKEMAAILGVGPSTFGCWLTGRRSPGILKAINKKYGTNFKYPKKVKEVKEPEKEIVPRNESTMYPAWIKNHPEWKQPILAQEYFIDPERANYFAIHIKTPEDIQRVRNELREKPALMGSSFGQISSWTHKSKNLGE